MNCEQVELLRVSIINTFPSHCTNKEISFAMQSLVKHVCTPLRVWLFNLVLTQTTEEKGVQIDLIWSFMTHKYANYILSSMLESDVGGELSYMILLMKYRVMSYFQLIENNGRK